MHCTQLINRALYHLRFRGCTGALTPGVRRRNMQAPRPPPPPSEFDSKDFAARCKFKVSLLSSIAKTLLLGASLRLVY